MEEDEESAYKPGSVEGDHSSGIHVTVNLKQPTRKRTRIGAALRRYGKRRNRKSCFPIWPCSRWGLPCRPCYQGCGALLPHRFTLTVLHGSRREVLGGLFSVALSVGSRLPGVTWHLIRRSPDFPPPLQARAAITQPTPRVHHTGLRGEVNLRLGRSRWSQPGIGSRHGLRARRLHCAWLPSTERRSPRLCWVVTPSPGGRPYDVAAAHPPCWL
jgi:hypothetical protein